MFMILMSKIDSKSMLEQTIADLRETMIQIGIQEGLTSEKAVTISQILDTYILKYQTLKFSGDNK